MMNSNVERLFLHVGPASLTAFGERQQMVKCIEECGELTQVLAKRLNGSPVTDAQLIDEIADVLVMAHQMRLKYGAEAVDARMELKLKRLGAYILSLDKPPSSQL